MSMASDLMLQHSKQKKIKDDKLNFEKNSRCLIGYMYCFTKDYNCKYSLAVHLQ